MASVLSAAGVALGELDAVIAAAGSELFLARHAADAAGAVGGSVSGRRLLAPGSALTSGGYVMLRDERCVPIFHAVTSARGRRFLRAGKVGGSRAPLATYLAAVSGLLIVALPLLIAPLFIRSYDTHVDFRWERGDLLKGVLKVGGHFEGRGAFLGEHADI